MVTHPTDPDWCLALPGLQRTLTPRASPQQGQNQGTQRFQPMSPVRVKLALLNAVPKHNSQRVS